jgi:hypothetical protein
MHVHTYLDLNFVQRVTSDPADCDSCRHAANSLVDVRHCHCRPCVAQRAIAESEIREGDARDAAQLAAQPAWKAAHVDVYRAANDLERLPEDTAKDIAAELSEQGFEVYHTDVRHPACGEWVHVLNVDSHVCPAADFR